MRLVACFFIAACCALLQEGPKIQKANAIHALLLNRVKCSIKQLIASICGTLFTAIVMAESVLTVSALISIGAEVMELGIPRPLISSQVLA